MAARSATDSCLSVTFATLDGFEVSFCMSLQACRELARRYGHTSQVLKGSCLVPLGGSSQTSHPKPMPSKFHVEAFAAKSTPRTLPQSAAPRRGTERVGVDRTLPAVTSRCRPPGQWDGRSESDRGEVGWWIQRQHRCRAQKDLRQAGNMANGPVTFRRGRRSGRRATRDRLIAKRSVTRACGRKAGLAIFRYIQLDIRRVRRNSCGAGANADLAGASSGIFPASVGAKRPLRLIN